MKTVYNNAMISDEELIITHVRDFLAPLDIAKKRVLVAVSGGPDSMALLDVLHRLGITLAVGHVHHGLRTESELEAEFVRARAVHYGVPFYMRLVDVRGRMAERGESLETAARELRRVALREMAVEAGASVIATGHNADDQAETVLMRILRGTGVRGLGGIPPRNEEFIRPLLPVWRAEILDYLREHELPYRLDPSNNSPAHLRNRLRHQLLPLLEDEYASRLRERLAHLADIARADNTALEQWAATCYRQYAQPTPGGISLPHPLEVPEAICTRVWLLALAAVRGDAADIGYDHLRAIAALRSGEETHLPGAVVRWEYDRLVFLPQKIAVEAFNHTLPVPGVVKFPSIGVIIITELLAQWSTLPGGDTALVDADAVVGELTVRSWCSGDRYQPLGAPGTRKLQDIFVDAQLPRRLRARVPVVCDEEGIVWLAGYRLADRVKIGRKTDKGLLIKIKWEFNPWTLRNSADA